MHVEALQKVFKTLHEPTRMRILGLLEREELAVQDLTQVLGLPQSTMSRHLALLKEAGLITDRRDGTFVYYRFPPPRDREWREAWALARRVLHRDPVHRRDAASLLSVLESRATRTRRWFDGIGPEWDALRKVFDDDTHRARAISRLVSNDLLVADIGTGTGILARELAQLGVRVIAIDHSERMLEAARKNLEDQGDRLVATRLGEARALPLADGEVDATFAHMVLHYVPSPPEAIREMTRAVRAGGTVVLVDFVQHDREWMRVQLGTLWQGFPPETVHQWLEDSGLEDIGIDIQRPRIGSGDLPATFIATGRKPAPRRGRRREQQS